jgi:hypothetical protein
MLGVRPLPLPYATSSIHLSPTCRATCSRNGDSEITFLQISDLHQRAQQTGFQWLIAVDWNHETFPSTGHGKDVVTVVNELISSRAAG